MSKVTSQKPKVKGYRSELSTCDLRPATSYLRPATCDFRLATNCSAFSLIELIVVMAVIGILAVAAVIKFTGTESYNNRLAAQELRANLAYVRNLAMNRERTALVTFDKSANNYAVWIDETGTGAFVTAKDPVTQKDWVVDIAGKFQGAALSDVDINGGTNLYFSGTNGAPFYALWMPLTATGAVTLNSGLRVTITPITGRADLE
jgi:prepilin-type N-terminal cleavage/methylation domain-containing protein